MSVWASVCGDDPVIYDGGYGDTTPDDGFLDLTVGWMLAQTAIAVRSVYKDKPITAVKW